MVERYVLRRVPALALLLVLAGCSLMAPVQQDPPVADAPLAGEGGSIAEDASDALRPVNPAAGQFLSQAKNYQAIDDTPRAAAALERAIRIDPGHPLPWLELASLRLGEGEWRQAENLALKARNLAPRGSLLFEQAEALVLEIQKTPM